MEKKFFSKKQIETARNTNILEYMISKGETFSKQGNYFRHTEHSSWVYDSRKKMMHFNKAVKDRDTNSCITVARNIYDLNFMEAVADILGTEAERFTEQDFIVNKQEPFNYKKDVRESHTFFHAYNYLVNEREIDSQIVNAFKKINLISEDTRQNIVYKMTNRETKDNSDVVGVALRGTRFIEPEQRLIPDRAYYLFEHPGNDKTSLFYASLNWNVQTTEMKVFESPIEIMSYLSLFKEDYFWEYQKDNTEFCSMGGLKPAAVEAHYRKVVESNRKMAGDEQVPRVPILKLCVNNDEGGLKFIEQFKEYMREQKYSEKFIENNIKIELPISEDDKEKDFDYNDLLRETNKKKRQQRINQSIDSIQEAEKTLA